jgi:outer membrane protein assembly factor BamB
MAACKRGQSDHHNRVISSQLPPIDELRRAPSPAVAPQALASHKESLWISSRDARRLYCINPQTWTVLEETDTPGICWGGASAYGVLYFVSGEGPADDRYLRRYQPGHGFDGSYRVAVPEFTGSYLSFDGQSLYMSQWYKHRVLQLDPETGEILRTIGVGAEICGHTFANGHLYALIGTEQDGETWSLARLDLREPEPEVESVARVPFACRSLAFDGQDFWTNHRAANETVAFALPAA